MTFLMVVVVNKRVVFRDNWEEGDPCGLDWFEVVSRFPGPIHCLSPEHADDDSRCTLGYAAKKSGGFHLTVDRNSSHVLLRLLMAEMKLSWLVERNLRDMNGSTVSEISAKIAEIVNKESFERPTNTVPIDPRIEKIDEEISTNGFKPQLMRAVSVAIPNKNVYRSRDLSMTAEGVSNSGVLRALRTATGGEMRPQLMRAVSNNVAPSAPSRVALPPEVPEQEELSSRFDLPRLRRNN